MKPPGVRVSSGALRGRKLDVPAGIRPTEQKVREALFSIWGERLTEATVLDLFSGSGAVAIEAVSRGALAATAVESNRTALEVQRRNLALLPAGSYRLMAQPVERALLELGGRGEQFDLVFADPPYAWIPDAGLFAGCSALLRAGGLLAVEHSSRVVLPIEAGDLVRTDSRRYGESALSFYGKRGSESG
ncbi:MAG: 16S rRNA (guanine(966)-N(2))-methyltransferase RsmD [Thermoanaerobaculia bacterium]